jgi:hypothetical protein
MKLIALAVFIIVASCDADAGPYEDHLETMREYRARDEERAEQQRIENDRALRWLEYSQQLQQTEELRKQTELMQRQQRRDNPMYHIFD